MEVSSGRQRSGVGSALVQTGLKMCKQLGINAVVVLEHPEYYLRFGFSRSSHYGFECEYQVPEDVFMAMELQPGYLHDASGTIKYHAEFSKA